MGNVMYLATLEDETLLGMEISMLGNKKDSVHK